MKIFAKYNSVYRIKLVIILIIILIYQIQLGNKTNPVIFTSATFIEGPDHASILGVENNGYFGGTISNIGDFNADGITDVAIVGATTGLNKIYIFFGQNRPVGSLNANDANITFVEENLNDLLNIGPGVIKPEIEGIGDTNNDGFADFIVAASSYDNGTDVSAGIVYLILGGNDTWGMDVSLSFANASFVGEKSGNSLGESISGVGDTNIDGYDDFIIASRWYANGTTIQAGKAYLYYGRDTNDWKYNESVIHSNASFIGEKLGERTGVAVSGIGDVNNDGISDFAIGSDGFDNYGISNIGRVDIFFGSANEIWKTNQSTFLSNASFSGELDFVDYNDFGSKISSQIDYDNDGFDDVLIASPQYTIDTDGYEGKIYLISGAKSSSWTQNMNVSEMVNVTILGEYEDEVGEILESLGDINGDNFGDFMIGLPDYMDWNADSSTPFGKVHLFFGSTNMNQSISLDTDSANITFIGLAGDRLGYSLQNIGDINLDGRKDIAISATGYGSTDIGRVYIITGDYNLPQTNYFTVIITETTTSSTTVTETIQELCTCINETITNTVISTETETMTVNKTNTNAGDSGELNPIWLIIIGLLVVSTATGIYYRSAIFEKVRKS